MKPYSFLDNFDDLVSIGLIGLLEAIESYDFNKNIKFSTYACKRIQWKYMSMVNPFKNDSKNLSLQAELANDSKSTFEKFIASDSFEKFENRLNDLSDIKDINNLAKLVLTEKEYELYLLRFSNDSKCYTLSEVAKQMGITFERARMLKKRALRKIRINFNTNDDLTI